MRRLLVTALIAAAAFLALPAVASAAPSIRFYTDAGFTREINSASISEFIAPVGGKTTKSIWIRNIASSSNTNNVSGHSLVFPAGFTRSPSSTCSGSGGLAGGNSCRLDIDWSPTGTTQVQGNFDFVYSYCSTFFITCLSTSNNNHATTILRGNATTTGLAGRIENVSGTAAEPSHAFATSTEPYTFVVRNTGTVDLPITSLPTIGGPNPNGFSVTDSTCVTALPAGTNTTEPGTCTITVQFTPTVPGALTGTVQLMTGAGTLQSTLTGTGVLGAVIQNTAGSATETNHAFGTSTAPYSFTLRNTGNIPLIGDNSAIAITGSDSSEFKITGGTTCQLPLSLAGGSTCMIQTTFAPTTVGARNATLTVVSNAPTLNTTLTGTGSLSAVIQDTAGTTAKPTHAFGNVWQAGATYTFTLRNNGTIPITGANNVSFSGSEAADYTLSPGSTCGPNLAAASTCTLTVTFVPGVLGAPRNATMHVATSAGTQNTTLSGTGVAGAPPVEIRNSANTALEPSHDFGTVNLGSFLDYAYTIRNTSGTAITISTVTFSGANPTEFTRPAGGCGTTLNAGATCALTVKFTPTSVNSRNATLNVGITQSGVSGTVSSNVSGNGGGSLLQNDVAFSTGVNQKRWLDTLTLGSRSGLSDKARMTFDLKLSDGRTISPNDILVSNVSTTNDTAPGDGAFVPINGLLGSHVDIHTPAGGSSRPYVEADFSLSNIQSTWSDGYADISISSFLGIPLSCNGGTVKTSDRRIWVRFRDNTGALSAKYGSQIRIMSSIGTSACTAADSSYVGPQPAPVIKLPSIESVGGVAQPPNTQNAVVAPGEPVTFKFAGQKPSGTGFTGVNWRIRNATTGAMFTRTASGGWAACPAPCNTDALFTVASGAKLSWPADNDVIHRISNVEFPARGRWIVEGAPQGVDEDDSYFAYIGGVSVNSDEEPTADFNISDLHPPTDGTVTLTAFDITDPFDEISLFDTQGGRGTNIEWDLDGNDSNGPGNDGFESRTIGDPASGLPAGGLTRAIDTTGKTPGSYMVRARVTDNGGLSASDASRMSTIVTKTFAINSPPEPNTPPVDIDVDETQPRAITLTADDADGDPYTYDVTDTTMVGEIAGTNVDRTYTWPTTWTGIDEFPVVAFDDHNGSESGTLTVRVHPNTTLDTADPTGATQQQTAAFTFSSPQTPVTAYECRLLRSDYADQSAPYEVVTGEDWATCASASTGSKSYADLPDGDYKFEVRAVNPDDLKDITPAAHLWRVDNTAPEVNWQSGPIQTTPAVPAPWNDPTPTYQVKSIDKSPQASITYECRVLFGPEAGNWKPCGSPSTSAGSAPIDLISDELDPTPLFGLTAPLLEGTYEFEMRATDEVGQTGPASKQTFKIDLTPPGTSIGSGPDGLINTRVVDFSVTSTEAGATFQCTLTGASQGVVYPTGPCPGGASPHFENLADDVYTLKVESIDPALNVDPDGPEANFEVDATAPETELDSAPPARTQSRHAEFVFHGNDARQLAGFQCRFDSTSEDDWATCQSPETFGGLSDGDHTLDIRAVDEATNADPTPEHFEWTVDRTAPQTDFDVTPSEHSNVTTPPFEFEADEDSTYECKVDNGTFASCTSPFTTSALADGPHTFTVQATDLAGNVEATPRTYSWSVDTVLPGVAINAHPTNPAPAGDAEFGFDVTDGSPPAAAPEVTTECSYDSGAWNDCESPFVVSDPSNGGHTFAVRATDQAGNVSTAATYGWTVMSSEPDPPTIDNSSPADFAVTRSTSAAVAFSHPLENDASFAGFECRLDDDAWKPCDSPYKVTGLDDGFHEINVRARDVVGNASESADLVWEVNSAVPTTFLFGGPSGLTKSNEAEFSYASDKPGATFECKIDDSGWIPCGAGAHFVDVPDGKHTFKVRAVVDATPAPLKDPEPKTRTWTVDTVAPGTTITSAPAGLVPSLSGTVAFNSNDPDAAFQCKVAEEEWDACSSPNALTNLAEGVVNYQVRAVDAAGNVDGSPATASWTAVAPAAPIDQTPAPVATGDNAINATLTGGSLKLGPLDPLSLPVGQIVLAGQNNGGTVSIPESGIAIKPISTPVSLGTAALDVKIVLSATGPAAGTIPPAGGAASLTIPLQAKVEAYLAGSPVLGATSNCILGPLNFKLTGSYDAATKKLTLSQPDVAVPTAGEGCGALGGQVNTLLGLPSSANSVNLEFSLGQVTIPADTKPPDTKPPTVAPGALALGRLSSKIAKNVVSVPVTCKGAADAAACSGEVRLTTKVKSGRKTKVVVLAKKSYSVRAGKQGTVKLKLSSSALKRIKAAGRKGLKTSVEIWPKGSKKAAIQKSLTLKTGGRK